MSQFVSYKRNIFNKIIKYLGFCAGFVIIHLLLNYIMVPATDTMRLQAHDLDSQAYDIIAIGPSDCLNSFDTRIVEDTLNKPTFNYGIRAATVSGGIRGAFDNAMAKQHPNTIIFILPLEMLKYTDDEEAIEVYNRSAIYYSNPLAAVKYFTIASQDGGAINRFFTWKNMFTTTLEPTLLSWVFENTAKKKFVEYKTYNKDWYNQFQTEKYIENGYMAWPENYIMTYNNVSDLRERYLGEWKDEIPELNQREINALTRLIRDCRSNGIEVYVVAGPQSFSGINANQYYRFESEFLKYIVESEDGTYYDINMLKKDYYRASEREWANTNHLNEMGAGRWTKVLCNLIQRDGFASSETDLFYSCWNEFLQSLDDIYGVGIATRDIDGKDALVGYAITAPYNQLEFSFTCYDADNPTNEIILQNYGKTNYIYASEYADSIAFAQINTPVFRCYARVNGVTHTEHYADHQHM